MTPVYASQPSLFRATPRGEYAPPPATPGPLSPTSSLAAAIQGYHAYLAGGSYSRHTVKAFIGDPAAGAPSARAAGGPAARN